MTADKIVEVVNQWKIGINNMNRQINSDNPKSFSELKIKKRLMTSDEDMARVNPYIKYSDSFRINCAFCSAAYDLRRRGFDVEADLYDVETNIFEIYSWWTHSITRNTLLKQKAFDRLYPGYHYFETGEYPISEIEDAVRNNGSRGQISFIWQEGNAHSVIYENNYGKVLLRDCQHNRKLKFVDYAKLSKRIYFFRTDNEQPTNRILVCVKNKTVDDTYFSDKGSMDTLIKMLRKEGYNAKRSGSFVRVDLKNRYVLINSNGELIVGNILKERNYIK